MLKKIIFTLIIMFIFVGCGGGGDSDNNNNLPTAPNESQQADINYYNSKQIAISSYNSTGIIKDGDYGDMFYQKKISDSTKLLNKLSIQAKSISFKIVAYDKKEYCENGGSYTSTEISSNETEVKYSNCKIDNITYNGYAKAKKVNNNYAIVEFKDFLIENNEESLILTEATFKIDTALSTIKIENMYAIDTKDSLTTTYLNYNTSYIFDENENIGTLTFNGWVKNNCINGYVYIKSTNEISFNFDNHYINGSMEVSSKGDFLSLSFEDDILRIYNNYAREEIINLEDLSLELEECR